jgi:tetratricopeptide (TPR) repeat protein
MNMNGSMSERFTQSWYKKGCILAKAGKLAEAVAAFTSAIDGNDGLADAYFRRGVCYYLLGNCRMAASDLDAASLLGCRNALLWSRYDFQRFDASVED